ncbi:hypothetical protein DXV75_16480 [Alteromonas aestuariivivens]|uniref:PBP domain-containing protein n=1 Tax=Alteromonas aestuariivivens TaxID=1938339 RepID=A0A3D8M2X8_9ALTE|nr:hypothetical protein [Alteromonas aestuariivivens]RDV23960.1 hypothetical protein DXV75_16480 [Alteromonas aestuariivivens]
MTTAAACRAQQYPVLKVTRHCLFALACLFFVNASHADGEPLAIIANHSVTTLQLSRSEVRQIFTANKQYWPDGSKITVFVMDPRTSIHKNFCQQKLQMFPYQLERLWNQVTFSGQGSPPVKVSTHAELIQAVKSTPGAIGYAIAGESGDVQTIRVNNS